MNKSTVIFLMGPTASGKTDLAFKLCDADSRLEIISVDSAMIYKGLDIGSAKPSKEVLTHYPHHLVDFLSPDQPYSAHQFVNDATKLIQDICARGRVPLLVGGTMMYFNALLEGISDLPGRDEALRERLDAELSEKGHQFLHSKLQSLCPVTAKKLHPNDTQRLIRAIEVCELSKKPMAELYDHQVKPLEGYSLIQLSLEPRDRAWLHERIKKRFLIMLEQGFLKEVETLLASGLSLELPSMKTVGYRQAAEYLQGKISEEEMIQKAISATRGLAKRQLTWLRRWQGLHRFECESDTLLENVLETIR